ncbi:MAG: class I SAM-dependent methyltransferase [Acidimicrobiales bacterium]|nr:class I SAM-dependent methyltransferase [Acidimicrobiales bacterium]
MDGYDSTTYGERIAGVYDEWYGDEGDLALTRIGSPNEVADHIAVLAGSAGKVLELGVGTGRLALPLADRGLAVTGLDASPSMLGRLRSKQGAERLTLIDGDMADPSTCGSDFDVVLIGFNTLFNLTSEKAQQACFRGVANLLTPDGHFVLEGFVPAPEAHDGVTVRHISIDRVMLDVVAIDPDSQTITGQRIEMTSEGNRFFPYQLRYATPDQLDDMAISAGLELINRSEDWRSTPFTGDSPTHVSTWRRRDNLQEQH